MKKKVKGTGKLGFALIMLLLNFRVFAVEQWFEDFKADASAEELYRFLYAMPKGGDLHNHLTGANFSEWWYELATDSSINGGYQYYTKVKINNCAEYGTDQFGFAPYLLLFRNLQKSSYDALSSCEQGEYKLLDSLTDREKTGWLNSIRLDKPSEGRDEFFQAHWQRLADLAVNPYINAEMMVKNMQAFSREGVSYVEMQEGTRFYKRKDGSFFEADEVADLFRQRLKKKDAVETKVTLRMQYYLLRFTPDAEKDLEWIYRFVDRNRDLFVAINMVGREDDDKGYPLRFLPVLRKMRQKIPGINLSIHAGEVDEPNAHVKDTLLLGATRIGHGINLIDDPDTMLLMRNGAYLVEINLISNLLLKYVDDYSQHPFPEYLRTGIPVALSTDDRGMWDSNLTDEFYVAVKEFNLSWEELTLLSKNSLAYSFVEPDLKKQLVENYQRRINQFVADFKRKGLKSLTGVEPVHHRFICDYYGVCAE